MFVDQLAQSESIVQFSDEKKPAIGGHPRALEIDLQKPVER
jgi:hypothetical protein